MSDKWTTIEELQRELLEAKIEIDDIDRSFAGRLFDDDTKERWNRANGRVDELEQLISQREARERRIRELGSRPQNTESEPTFGGHPNAGERDAALRANERASFLPDASRAAMEAAIRADDDPENRMAELVVALADRDYFRAFAAWQRDPVSGGHEWTDRERAAVKRVKMLERAMALGAGGTGGFLVPYELDPSVIIAGTGAASPLRELSRVETTAQNEKRFVTSVGVTSTWTDEAAQQSDDAPALLQPTVAVKKGAAFVPVSLELFEDSGIAMEIGKLFADAKLVQEALGFTITQTGGPTGIITALVAAGGGTIIATGTNVLAQGDLFANQAALPARWRPGAKWMMNLAILNGYRQLPQATGLNYSIVDDSGPRPKALGWEIFENSNMDSTLTATAADYLVLSGDFSQFVIVDRIGTTVEVIPHLFGANQRPTGQRGFYMHFRVGTAVLVADAFRLSNFST